MSKVVRLVVPIVVTAVVAACGCWLLTRRFVRMA